MFRLSAKEMKNGRCIKDMIYKDDSETNRTAKVMRGVQTVCHEWNLAVPIWLDLNIKDFKSFSMCRFNQDSFIETLDFDYLEIRVIEED